MTNYAKMNVLQRMLAENVEEFCIALKLKMKNVGGNLIGCCGVHGGRDTNMTVYPEGKSNPGWICYSRSCQKIFKNTLIGLARGVLSHIKNDWTPAYPDRGIVPFKEALDFCCDFVGTSYDKIKGDSEADEKYKFARMAKSFAELREEKGYICTRSDLEKILDIPAKSFIKRGFQPETLHDYSVGLYVSRGEEMRDRIVCPIFEDEGKYVVSVTGRSIHVKCKKCGQYHKPEESCSRNEKWKILFGTKANSYLYNYWRAKEFIAKNKSVILVEGVLDVLKLVECGVINVLGLFGNTITDRQRIILDQNPIYDIILLLDNDEVGHKSMANLRGELQGLYRVHNVNWEGVAYKDVGEMSVDIIKDKILSQFNKVKL